MFTVYSLLAAFIGLSLVLEALPFSAKRLLMLGGVLPFSAKRLLMLGGALPFSAKQLLTLG